jgi:hypothetical protein
VEVRDAGGRALDGARIAVRVRDRDVELAADGPGRFASAPMQLDEVPPTVRVRVTRRGRAWTFDRPLDIGPERQP